MCIPLVLLYGTVESMLLNNCNEFIVKLIVVIHTFQAEQAFLKSKPASFLVLGKPGAGKTTLAKNLAKEWKCQFINGKHLSLSQLFSFSK